MLNHARCARLASSENHVRNCACASGGGGLSRTASSEESRLRGRVMELETEVSGKRQVTFLPSFLPSSLSCWFQIFMHD